MKIMPFTRHITSHNTPQSSAIESDTNYDYVDMKDVGDSLVYVMMQQGSLFIALKRIKEINKLNSYQVFSDWEIRRIKKHFRNIKVENVQTEKQNIGFTNNKLEKIQRGKHYAENKAREMQKGYMQMLTAYQNSI